jgi:hypothetical protein
MSPEKDSSKNRKQVIVKVKLKGTPELHGMSSRASIH